MRISRYVYKFIKQCGRKSDDPERTIVRPCIAGAWICDCLSLWDAGRMQQEFYDNAGFVTCACTDGHYAGKWESRNQRCGSWSFQPGAVPGSSKEMAVIFFAMAIGLATGTGFLGFAAVMTLVIGSVFLALEKSRFGEWKQEQKDLRITIAEHLDYTEIFDDIFRKYTSKCCLERVKTTNLGSMYELDYHITLKDHGQEKEMLDAIRCRNGNLTVVCGRRSALQEGL